MLKTIIIILSTLLCITNTNASAKIEKQNIYYARYGGGKPYLSDKVEYFEIDGNTAYCIEPGMPISTTDYIEMNELPYSNDIIEKIKLIGYYGYNYENHKTNNYRLATQALIWNLIGGQKVDFYTKQYGYGDYIDISKEKEEIQNLINKHYLKPTINDIEEFYNNEIIIKDANEVLDNYEIEYQGKNNVQIKNNTLIIKILKQDKLILKRKKYDNKTSVFYEGNNIKSQMIAVLTLDEIDKIEINLSPIFGELKINKKSNKESIYTLKDAIYGIYDLENNLIKEIKTDEKGNAQAKLTKGKYYLKELKAPLGYHLDETKHYFEIDKENLIKELILEEEVIESKIKLKKMYGNSSKELYDEPNITFLVYKNNELINKITTNEIGEATIILPYGKYTIKQENTKEGYLKVNDFEITVDGKNKELKYELVDEEINAFVKIIKKDYETNETIKQKGIKFKIKNLDKNEYICENKECTYETNEEGYIITSERLKGNLLIEECKQYLNGYIWNKEKIKIFIGDKIIDTYIIEFKNKRVKGQIKILKQGENELLENVKFNLYAKDNIIINNKIIYKKNELILTKTTNKEGIIIFDNLELGNYYIKEIETNNNYILDDKEYEISLKYKDEETSIIKEYIEIKNYLKRGKLVFYKIDSLTKEKLENAVIQIYKDNELIKEEVTNIDGLIELNDLLIGNYYIIEKEAPKGYIKSENIIEFEIKYNEVTEITMENDPIIEVPNTIKNSNYKIITLLIIGLLKKYEETN
ncbi:MAG: Cys-Gln thioester bond-forming surface protein [Firmicutes bacterium]|nr:Cys-Gln thioester bond-forming surface protein [Bacillota bacterium]